MLRLEHQLEGTEPHFYGIYIWDDDNLIESLSREIVPLIREMYAKYEELKEAINQESEFTPSQLKAFLAHRLETLIPDIPVIDEGLDEKAKQMLINKDITRSELAEIVAQYILQLEFGTIFPLPNLTKKERRDSASRGTDVWGIERVDEKLYLIISEAKASMEPNSPPRVVHKNDDCLLATLAPSAERGQKIMYALQQSLNLVEGENRLSIMRAIKSLISSTEDNFQIIVVPFLMRQDGYCTPDDLIPFAVETNLTQFKDELVRYIIFKVKCDLNELAHHLYSRARDVAWNG